MESLRKSQGQNPRSRRPQGFWPRDFLRDSIHYASPKAFSNIFILQSANGLPRNLIGKWRGHEAGLAELCMRTTSENDPNSSTHGRPSKRTKSSETRVTSEKSLASRPSWNYVIGLCVELQRTKYIIFFKYFSFCNVVLTLASFLLSNYSRPRANKSQTAIFVAKRCSFADIGFGFGLPWHEALHNGRVKSQYTRARCRKNALYALQPIKNQYFFLL